MGVSEINKECPVKVQTNGRVNKGKPGRGRTITGRILRPGC